MTLSEMNSAALCAVSSDSDVVAARQLGRRLAEELGFGRAEQALIATAISELARNIVNYAGHGVVEIGEVMRGRKLGLRVVARDRGPGIKDVELAMRDGFSTGKSLGLGLPGTRRMADEFEIDSAPGAGVTVKFVKWRQR
jgi:serine/threonine-protein kinase RsbT